METLLHDLRYAVRMLAKSPGFTAVAVLSLALGIGANASIFSIMDAMLLRELPVKEPHRLVSIAAGLKHDLHNDFSYPGYVDVRDHSAVLEGVAAYTSASVGLSGAGQTERISADIVTSNYFHVLGAGMQMGAGFSGQDELSGAAPVAILSHGLWQRLFGGDTAILDRNISLNGVSYQVVGIAQPGFTGFARGAQPDVWVPVSQFQRIVNMQRSEDILRSRNLSFLALFGRLKPGVTPQQAAEQMTAIQRQLAGGDPEVTMNVLPAAQGELGEIAEFRRPLQVLLGAVVLILAIACANVANLLLARAKVREREIGTRLALGATRYRLARQLLTESLLLSFAGGALGLLIALWASDLAQNIRTVSGGAIELDYGLNPRVLAFTLAVSVVTALVFGTIPALRAARQDTFAVMKGAADAPAAGHRLFSLRGVLVAVQVMLSLVLLVGAGLFLRSLDKLNAVDLGMRSEQVLAMNLDLRLQGYDRERGAALYPRLLERVRAIPGVESAALTFVLPVNPGGMRNTSPGNEFVPPVPDKLLSFDMQIVSPQYFRTLDFPLVAGREFTDQDTATSAQVLIVNEAFAKKFWPNSNPVGQQFIQRGGEGRPDTVLHVVGVARNTKYRNLREEPRLTVYQPLSQFYEPRLSLIVRSAADRETVVAGIRNQLRQLDPGLPLYGIRTLPEHVGRSLSLDKMRAALLAIFGMLALALAAIGVYGMMAYAVAQRTREIGIRMALGAQAQNVLAMVIRHGIALAAAGIVAGLVGAWWLGGLVSSQLYQVQPFDPLTLVACSTVLLLIALLAVLVPARRAAKLDPMVALRYE